MAEDWIADRTIVVDPATNRVLSADEDQTGVFVAAEGAPVSDADCKRYGIGPYAGQAEADDAESTEATADAEATDEAADDAAPEDPAPAPAKAKK